MIAVVYALFMFEGLDCLNILNFALKILSLIREINLKLFVVIVAASKCKIE